MGQENVAGDVWQLSTASQLEDLFTHIERAIALQIRTHVPAAVKAYNPLTNTAVLTVQIQEVFVVPDLLKLPKKIAGPPRGIPPNAEVTMLPIELVNIPVAWPKTAAGYLTFPLALGDTGLLHVNDRSVKSWLLAGLPTEPVLTFTHALVDSVFHAGYSPTTLPIVPPVDTTAVVLEGTQIKIGRLAASAMLKGTEMVAAIDAAIAAAITAGAGSPGSGAASFTAFQSSWNLAKAGFQSVKTKVE